MAHTCSTREAAVAHTRGHVEAHATTPDPQAHWAARVNPGVFKSTMCIDSLDTVEVAIFSESEADPHSHHAHCAPTGLASTGGGEGQGAGGVQRAGHLPADGAQAHQGQQDRHRAGVRICQDLPDWPAGGVHQRHAPGQPAGVRRQVRTQL